MFADFSHSTSTSLTNRLALLFWRLSHALEAKDSSQLPAELSRLSDHQLRDIGVDPRDVRLPAQEASAVLELLQREWP
jgi:uncharacterized protein YjiS (DUF1127 family)